MNLRILPCLFIVASATPAFAQPDKETPVQRVIRGTARVVKPGGSGTGWIVDRDRRILVTNLHVVSNINLLSEPALGQELRHVVHDTVELVFPDYRPDGSLITEKSHYRKNQAELVKAGRWVKAKVIDADVKRDLAVVQADSLPADTVAIPLAARSQNAGDEHFSIGNPGATDFHWVFTSGRTRARGFQEWRSTGGGVKFFHHACQVLNTEAQVNPGDSGGPVVSKEGELVAVTQGFATTDRAVSYVIDVSEVRDYLKEVDWMFAPKTVADFHRRARYYLERGRIQRAAADIDVVINRRSEQPDILDDDWLDAVAIVRDFGNYPAALQNCARAFAEPKHRPGRRFAERAATLLSQLPNEAFIPVELKGPQWKPLIERGKNDPEYRKALAEAQKKHNEFWGPRKQAVLDDIAAALKEDPKSVLALKTRARYQGRLVKPDYEQIIADRTAVVKILNNAVNHDVTSLLERADAYSAAKQYDKAVADCEAALKIAPRSVVAHVRLARALIASGNNALAYDRALRLIQPFIDANGDKWEGLEPENPDHCELLAWIAHSAKNWSEVVVTLGLAIDRTAKLGFVPNRRHYADRGDAYVELKDFARARADYLQAMKIPDKMGDQKPDSALVELYQEMYSVKALEKKLRSLP